MHETTAMAKKKLISEPLSYPDLGIIGISSLLKEHRLVHFINQSASLSLVKFDNVPVYQEKKKKLIEFSLFASYDSYKRLHYYLIENLNHEARLIPDKKQADYILLSCGPADPDLTDTLIRNIRSIDGVALAFPIAPSEIKNLEGIMNDLELHMVGKEI